MTPKKPNSAIRKVAKVNIKLTKEEIPKKKIITSKTVAPKKTTKKTKVAIKPVTKTITCYIPGEKHTVGVNNVVLIRKGKTKDLPGVKHKIIKKGKKK